MGASRFIGTIVQETVRPTGPLLLAIHTVLPLKDSVYASPYISSTVGSLYTKDGAF